MRLHVSQKLQTLLAKEVITSIAQMWRCSSLFQILYQTFLQPYKPLNARPNTHLQLGWNCRVVYYSDKPISFVFVYLKNDCLYNFPIVIVDLGLVYVFFPYYGNYVHGLQNKYSTLMNLKEKTKCLKETKYIVIVGFNFGLGDKIVKHCQALTSRPMLWNSLMCLDRFRF